MAKVIQANVNRCKTAMDLLYAEAKSSGYDIIAVSEPNRAWLKNPSWVVDTRKDVALLCMPGAPRVINSGGSNGFAWLELDEYVIYSCYITRNMELENFREEIRILQDHVRRQQKEVIVTGDFNSDSVVWGSRVTDTRGDIIMDWTAASSMVILNDGLYPTYVARGFESF